MKKKFLILCSILVVIYLVLSLLDNGEYRFEKQMWRMAKNFYSISKDPKAVPDAQFEKVIADYRAMIKKFPDSKYVPQVYSQIGMLYVMQKKYDDARKAYGEVVTGFSEDPVTVSKALMDIGNTYLFQERVKEAVDIYHRLWTDYGKTEVGFMMPLYIAGVYRSLNKDAMVQQYLERALVFYQGIARDEASGHAMQLNAYQSLATVYMAQQKWEKAIESLKSCLYLFADSPTISPRRLAMITRILNTIFIMQMKDFDRGIGFYEQFIADHPNHNLDKYIEKVIESLKYLKERDLSASTQKSQS
ncbi:MAG: tetratricopeptide repeat protein [Candidatus Omnitrophota bacterium]